MESKNHQRRKVRPNIARRVRLQPKSLKARKPSRHLALISQREKTSLKEPNEEVGAEEHRLPVLETLRRNIDQKERNLMTKRSKARRPKMELPRAVTKRRRLSLKSRKISSTKTHRTSKRRRPSKISTKSGNLVTGRKARARLSSHLRPSSHQFQPSFSPSLMSPPS